jgi:hypothetical protein
LVRFSWFAHNSQDFFTIEFNEYRTFGWETTYSSRQTVLSRLHLTPEEVGLTPGTWYWRVCFGWYEGPTTCYFDDDTRTLEVEEPEPFLSLASARSAAPLGEDPLAGARACPMRATCGVAGILPPAVVSRGPPPCAVSQVAAQR